MLTQMQDFFAEQLEAFKGQVPTFDGEPLAAMRQGVTYSVEGLKSLERPVRIAARSSVKLSSVSQQAMQELIELQTDMVTSALTEMAAGLERVADAKDAVTFFDVQADAARARADRLVAGANRAMAIFTNAGHGVQQVIAEAYEQAQPVAKSVPDETPSAKPRASRRARKSATEAAA